MPQRPTFKGCYQQLKRRVKCKEKMMEVFVEFEISCNDSRSAERMASLFRSLSEIKPETEIASSLGIYNLDSNEISGLRELVEQHLQDLACLETAEVDGQVFRSSFVCGRGAENFLPGLASVSDRFEASITKLTARYDEGVYVCDLIDGEPHLEEFEEYESYLETGFVNLEEPSSLAELLSAPSAQEDNEKRERVFAQPEPTPEEFVEQERSILSIAKKYYEDTFNGVPLAFDEWYSEEYRASGALQWFEFPEDLAESNKEWADEHDGVEQIDLRVKGQIEGLVSIDAEIRTHDGKAKETNSCWLFQNDRWKLHNSCAQILFETRDMSDEEIAEFKQFEELFTKFPTENT
jgi:hypothetical protein